MPELPEVEGFRVVTERALLGATITRARFLDDWMLKDTSPSGAARRMKGRTVSSVDRRGKVLAVFTEAPDARAPVLALHFGMTGHPVADDPDGPPHRWDRVVLDLDTGDRFRYRNSRRLGWVRVVSRNEIADLAWQLGPDALEAPVDYLVEAFAYREGPIKGLLLDQSLLAGVGNMYADEILFATGIHPERRGGSLTADDVKRVHSAMGRILRRAVKAHRAGKDAAFPIMRVRHRASKQLGASGAPRVGCPRCSRPLRAARVAGRTSFYCPSCQR